MHSNPLGPSEKLPFFENYKERAICAIVREKKPFLGHSQRLKKVLRVLRCAKNTFERPKKMQIPRSYQKKTFFLYKVCDFFNKLEILVFRGVGWVPQKSADFGATAPA